MDEARAPAKPGRSLHCGQVPLAARRGLGQASGVEAKRIIDSPADAFALFADMIGDAQERLCAALLDAAGDVLALRVGPPGDGCSAPMPITRILRDAVTFGASDLIVAHNHPGGDPAPSLQDVRATRRLAEGADALGLRLVDHIVVARGGWASFRLLGLI
jgi:DNA repair protein RadC